MSVIQLCGAHLRFMDESPLQTGAGPCPDLVGGDPHILLKDGITVAAAVESGKTFDEKEQALALEVTY